MPAESSTVTQKDSNSHEVSKAFWALGDYFSRLGGSARYFNMPESDIPLYIACQLTRKHSSYFDQKEYVENQFIDAAAPVLWEVHLHLDKVTAQDDELIALIHDFTKYSDSKLKPQDRSPRWKGLSELINELSHE